MRDLKRNDILPRLSENRVLMTESLIPGRIRVLRWEQNSKVWIKEALKESVKASRLGESPYVHTFARAEDCILHLNHNWVLGSNLHRILFNEPLEHEMEVFAKQVWNNELHIRSEKAVQHAKRCCSRLTMPSNRRIGNYGMPLGVFCLGRSFLHGLSVSSTSCQTHLRIQSNIKFKRAYSFTMVGDLARVVSYDECRDDASSGLWKLWDSIKKL